MGRPKPELDNDEKLGSINENVYSQSLEPGEQIPRVEATEDPDDPIERRYLIRRPKAHQWFEDDILMKASDRERVAGKFELFYDLLYVALVRGLCQAV